MGVLGYPLQVLGAVSAIVGLWVAYPNPLLFAIIFFVLVMILLLSYMIEDYRRKYKYYGGVLPRLRDYIAPEVQSINSAEDGATTEPSGKVTVHQLEEAMLLSPAIGFCINTMQ